MFLAVTLGFFLWIPEAPAPAGTSTTRDALEVYRSKAAGIGRDAAAHVKLALWCEAHGLDAERLKHLARAVLIDPDQQTARGLLGLVASQGKWRKPDEVSARLEEDPSTRGLIAEYLERRSLTPDTPDAQWKLGRWCEEHGLTAQASAHDRAVVRLDPNRGDAWSKLGYKRDRGGWARPEELAARAQEAEAQRRANQHWKPIVERERKGLLSKDPARRARASAALTSITDPRAVPVVWELLASGGPAFQLKALEVLGQLDGPAASRAIAALAVFSPFPEVRGRAIDTAERRDAREFLDDLLTMIRRPFRYKVQPLNGPGSEGGLFVEGERFNIQRIYQVAPINTSRIPARLFSPDVPFNAFDAPNVMVLAGRTVVAAANNGNYVFSANTAAIQRDQLIAQRLAEQSRPAREAQESLAQDIQTVEAWNQTILATNERVLPLARSVTGQDFGTSGDAWLKWWNDQLGYVYQSPSTEPKPTYTQLVQFTSTPVSHSACFAAGTPVHTLRGLRPIEELQVGDQVLSQDPASGALSFQSVLVVHRNPPSPTLKLRTGGETLVATGIHRFWKAGKGWTMARDLRAGDVLRVVGGTARLESVEPGPTQPVFNLDVAENRDFFVGRRGCLVYDFSLVQPVTAPFDRPAD